MFRVLENLFCEIIGVIQAAVDLEGRKLLGGLAFGVLLGEDTLNLIPTLDLRAVDPEGWLVFAFVFFLWTTGTWTQFRIFKSIFCLLVDVVKLHDKFPFLWENIFIIQLLYIKIQFPSSSEKIKPNPSCVIIIIQTLYALD